MSLLSWLLVILAGISLAAMVVSISIGSRAAREARSTIFPLVRGEETTRARRARIATSVTGVVATILAGAFFLSGQLPSPTLQPPQSPTQAVAIAGPPMSPTDTPAAPTETPPPPVEVQASATDSQVHLVTVVLPTPSATPILAPPTGTPSPALLATAIVVPRTPTPTTAPANAQMGPIAFTSRISDRREPISPTTVFSDSVNRVYATFPYSGMRNGVNWTHIWYFNGLEYDRSREAWQWGNADRSYLFTRLVGAGNYRLEIYVNDDLLASGEFQVQGPIAIGGPKSTEPLEGPVTLGDQAAPQGQETLEIQTTPAGQETPESPVTSENPEKP